MTQKKPQKIKQVARSGEKVCLVSKQIFPLTEMLHFVLDPENRVVFDVAHKLPGRGMWLYPDHANFQLAVRKQLFSKSAKMNVRIPANLEEQVLNGLKRRVLELLGFARKSGYLIFGFEGVRKAIPDGQIAVVLEAEDAARNGHEKLFRPTDPFYICTAFSREELGQVTGAEAQVHVAVLKSRIAEEIKQTVLKLDRFTGQQGKEMK